LTERASIYLVREHIADRKELRRLRKLPAMGMRGPNDLTEGEGGGGDLFCPGGYGGEIDGGFVIVWELRRWDPEMNSDPGAVERLESWRHLVAEGFQVITDKAELERRTGWKQY
jgi:hypothetical protein